MNLDLNPAREIGQLGERESALANRAGGLSIVAILLSIVSVIAMPAAFRETERADVRILSAAPLAGAAAAALRARVACRGLNAVRSRKRELLFEIIGVSTSANDNTTIAVPRTLERSAP